MPRDPGKLAAAAAAWSHKSAQRLAAASSKSLSRPLALHAKGSQEGKGTFFCAGVGRI